MGRRTKQPNGDGDWECANCHVYYSADEFYSSTSSSNGLMSWCKRCSTTYSHDMTREESEAKKRARELQKREHLAVIARGQDRAIWNDFVEMMKRRGLPVTTEKPMDLWSEEEMGRTHGTGE